MVQPMVMTRPSEPRLLRQFDINGNGSVTKDPDKVFYELGDNVQLTATPVTGGGFTGWGGDSEWCC